VHLEISLHQKEKHRNNITSTNETKHQRTSWHCRKMVYNRHGFLRLNILFLYNLYA